MREKHRFYQFHLSNKYSGIMPNALFGMLHNTNRQTVVKEYTVNKYVNENQEFLNDIYNILMNQDIQNIKKLYLLDAPQGSGKTSFFMNFVLWQAQNFVPTVIVEPKKSNIAQLKKNYPSIAVLTGESQVINGIKQYPVSVMTPVVVCTPELAAKAVYLLKKFFGYVGYFILDEAHDLLTSIPSYRDADKFFQAFQDIINNTCTKIMCITATPEPLSFIRFDMIFKVNACEKLGTDTLEIVNITNNDSKHMSVAACYAAAIKEQLTINRVPMLILVENKSLIEKMTNILSEEGYQCLSVHSGNIQENPVMNSIINTQTLPVFYSNRYVDVIFTTSTIISGITINLNPILGNEQFIMSAIIEDMYKLDIAALSQFFCRFRYHTTKTVIMKKTLKNIPKKTLTLSQCYGVIRNHTKMLEERSVYAQESCMGYNQETVTNLNAIYDCDKMTFDYFAIFCNALSERDARLYGHDDIFVQELFKTYSFHTYKVIQKIYETREQLKLACDMEKEEMKIIKVQKKEIKKMVAEKALQTDVIEQVFYQKKKAVISEEEKEFVHTMKKEMPALSMAFHMGGTGKVKEVVRKIAEGNMSQKAVNRTEFELFRELALSCPSKNIRITILEMTRMDADSVISGMKKEKLPAENVLKSIKYVKNSPYYQYVKSFGISAGITDLVSLLANSHNEHEFRTNIRRYNAARIVDAYSDKKCDKSDLSKDSVMGQEIMTLLELFLKDGQMIYKPGTEFGIEQYQEIARYLDTHVPLYAAFNQNPVAISQVKDMISDVMNGYFLKNGNFVLGNRMIRLGMAS